ncbi:MBL fold metallo-hydrolase [Azonexus sp. IMCC34839]|uniref:MBL fold metallo-hydrolase n=1 Tax=Azonexus sp. IMCC34839 TaxID=3133695 RepID=UPI00399A45FD
MSRLPIQMLGQSGCKFSFPEANVYVDPYLSNSVQELDADDLVRLVPIPFPPTEVRDADWILVTHDHMDHCDPHTLPHLASASPQARFICPPAAWKWLREWGVAEDRLFVASEGWRILTPRLRVCAVPAAHPEIARDENGDLMCVGYLLEFDGKLIYIAGDTFVRQEIVDAIKVHGEVHTAILPINEHNYFLGRRGILGNISVREAFRFAEEIGASNVIPVHWDMFAINSVPQEEIRLLYRNLNPPFALLLRPTVLSFDKVRISYVIRTLNESRHLGELLQGISEQQTMGLDHEVVLVDSGSTDGTLEIAERHGCHVHQITREQFSFGRSLNIGCEAARGDVIIIVSGHCIPIDNSWAQKLCQPILDGVADYTYGRQHPGANSAWSEGRIFAKYFGESSMIPQDGYFCNNANAAISRKSWEALRFNEELTGLEDMNMAQRLIQAGGRVAYVAEAGVLHLHEESWRQVRRRFEREAIALQLIMPQVHMRKTDVLRYLVTSIWSDWLNALGKGVLMKNALDIVRYRWNQYLGAYQGNHEHRKLSALEKEKYFYPNY